MPPIADCKVEPLRISSRVEVVLKDEVVLLITDSVGCEKVSALVVRVKLQAFLSDLSRVVQPFPSPSIQEVAGEEKSAISGVLPIGPLIKHSILAKVSVGKSACALPGVFLLIAAVLLDLLFQRDDAHFFGDLLVDDWVGRRDQLAKGQVQLFVLLCIHRLLFLNVIIQRDNRMQYIKMKD
jgi:hypothetical protein